MNLVCAYCCGTGWRVITTQGQHTPDGGGTYACTTWVRCECCCWVNPASTINMENRA